MQQNFAYSQHVLCYVWPKFDALSRVILLIALKVYFIEKLGKVQKYIFIIKKVLIIIIFKIVEIWSQQRYQFFYYYLLKRQKFFF